MTADIGLDTPLGNALAKLTVAAAHDTQTTFTAEQAQALFDHLDRTRHITEWLNGAGQRKTEPVRPDDPADIAARLVPKWSQPLTGPVGDARATLALAVQCLLEQWIPADRLVPLSARVVDSAELAAVVDAARVDERRHVAAAIEAAAPDLPARANAPLDAPLAVRAAYEHAARIAREV